MCDAIFLASTKAFAARTPSIQRTVEPTALFKCRICLWQGVPGEPGERGPAGARGSQVRCSARSTEVALTLKKYILPTF